MSNPYTSPEYGKRLLEWLPNHWRTRDDGGDLAGLLAVYGELLDTLHATVHQQLYDGFPDRDEHGNHCQDWLIPYFARLLDVQLVSPDADGRRAEVAKAVYWRQRKGSRVSLEDIAEAVGQFEVELQEGVEAGGHDPADRSSVAPGAGLRRGADPRAKDTGTRSPPSRPARLYAGFSFLFAGRAVRHRQ